MPATSKQRAIAQCPLAEVSRAFINTLWTSLLYSTTVWYFAKHSTTYNENLAHMNAHITILRTSQQRKMLVFETPPPKKNVLLAWSIVTLRWKQTFCQCTTVDLSQKCLTVVHQPEVDPEHRGSLAKIARETLYQKQALKLLEKITANMELAYIAWYVYCIFYY